MGLKFFGVSEFYRLIEEGIIKEGRSILSVDGMRYRVELKHYRLGHNLSPIEVGNMMVRPEAILEGKEWSIEK